LTPNGHSPQMSGRLLQAARDVDGAAAPRWEPCAGPRHRWRRLPSWVDTPAEASASRPFSEPCSFRWNLFRNKKGLPLNGRGFPLNGRAVLAHGRGSRVEREKLPVEPTYSTRSREGFPLSARSLSLNGRPDLDYGRGLSPPAQAPLPSCQPSIWDLGARGARLRRATILEFSGVSLLASSKVAPLLEAPDAGGLPHPSRRADPPDRGDCRPLEGPPLGGASQLVRPTRAAQASTEMAGLILPLSLLPLI
jgi:hypothetical protein